MQAIVFARSINENTNCSRWCWACPLHQSPLSPSSQLHPFYVQPSEHVPICSWEALRLQYNDCYRYYQTAVLRILLKMHVTYLFRCCLKLLRNETSRHSAIKSVSYVFSEDSLFFWSLLENFIFLTSSGILSSSTSATSAPITSSLSSSFSWILVF